MNMAAIKGSYHHANLEERLLEAASKIIESNGLSALSLRALGDFVGVSRSAPYHYFVDKDALLHRLGERGFDMLSRATEAAGAEFGDPVAQARAGLRGYLDFAQAHPQLFRLMFAGILSRHLSLPLGAEGSSYDFSSSAAAKAFAGIQAAIARLPDSAGLDSRTLMLRTNAIWAAVHGVATLAIDENLKLVAANQVLEMLLDRLIA
jgi:AcrR family transcriptional regulator